MGKRKLPFGYRMEMGKTALHLQEAETVQFIFQQYIDGASFRELVHALNGRGVPYITGKSWNKNMVARILADARYAGADGYPAVVEQSDLQKAERRRLEKQRPSQKTDAQKVLRQLSCRTATKSMEHQVLDLMNSLVGRPEKLHIQTVCADGDQCCELQSQLDKTMAIYPVDEELARNLILKLAAARYSMIGSLEYETERLQRIFAAAKPMETLDAELLKSTVSSIHLQENGAVCLELKNHQIISR